MKRTRAPDEKDRQLASEVISLAERLDELAAELRSDAEELATARGPIDERGLARFERKVKLVRELFDQVDGKTIRDLAAAQRDRATRLLDRALEMMATQTLTGHLPSAAEIAATYATAEARRDRADALPASAAAWAEAIKGWTPGTPGLRPSGKPPRSEVLAKLLPEAGAPQVSVDAIKRRARRR